jgi:hypothetical protein
MRYEKTPPRKEPPFTAQNRPWLTQHCIDYLNEQFTDSMSQIPADARESLREWAAVTVEMGACLEKPDVRARLRQWADELVRSQKLK